MSALDGIVEVTRENMKLAWKSGWETGVRDVLGQILATDEREQTYLGPIPEELRAWGEQTLQALNR